MAYKEEQLEKWKCKRCGIKHKKIKKCVCGEIPTSEQIFDLNSLKLMRKLLN